MAFHTIIIVMGVINPFGVSQPVPHKPDETYRLHPVNPELNQVNSKHENGVVIIGLKISVQKYYGNTFFRLWDPWVKFSIMKSIAERNRS